VRCNVLVVQPTAKRLVLDLLSTARDASLPVRAMIAAARLFDVAENSIRVELARLVARGLVERNERGQYRLAQAAKAVHRRVTSWTQLEDRLVSWSGRWIAVHTAGLGRSDRGALARRERAFEFLGFRELDPGLWIRPDNLRGGVEEIRGQLQDLGLDSAAPVFALADFDDACERRARSLWRIETLLGQYRELRAALERSQAKLTDLAPARALTESFLLGGKVLRLLAFDPLLPDPILAGTERRALIDTMRRYDEAGRRHWARFMRSHGAASRTTPVHLDLAGAPASFPPQA
jgi:phenylacetic acid degradation operon negative regulatory protein